MVVIKILIWVAYFSYSQWHDGLRFFEFGGITGDRPIRRTPTTLELDRLGPGIRIPGWARPGVDGDHERVGNPAGIWEWTQQYFCGELVRRWSVWVRVLCLSVCVCTEKICFHRICRMPKSDYDFREIYREMKVGRDRLREKKDTTTVIGISNLQTSSDLFQIKVWMSTLGTSS